ncbi:hypothetical protein LAZ67_16001921 [Cordylochernes scorpioides]|uniref:Retrovirus-related Pol polyprotein from transposon TNT 1-94 n=1 Tax=Cordylochernes scorpioides TaxID=51811 RepID=A0ABY6LBW5_9ARAC|nr:hypothetical protein LAZ67_16001921 [Cordylochernes scorpioides]
MESEYIALAQTTKEILWIAQILENLKCLTNASCPITIFCDNRATIEFSKNIIENNRSNDNLADIFTKGLKKTAHQNACVAINCLDTGILPGPSRSSFTMLSALREKIADDPLTPTNRAMGRHHLHINGKN